MLSKKENRPLRLGLTGCIASGKSVAAKALEYLGAAVYDSDSRAKWLMQNNTELKNELISKLGEACYTPCGLLDKTRMREIVFGSAQGRAAVNSIVHPAVSADFSQWCDAQPSSLLVLESALLHQSQTRTKLDVIAAVTAPLDERLSRLMLRDGIGRSQAMQKIEAQMADEQICSLSGEIIRNGRQDLLMPQLLAMLEKYGIL
jgi:dephospho-CoA kinase